MTGLSGSCVENAGGDDLWQKVGGQFHTIGFEHIQEEGLRSEQLSQVCGQFECLGRCACGCRDAQGGFLK